MSGTIFLLEFGPMASSSQAAGTTCARCSALLEGWDVCLACFLDPDPPPIEVEGFELGELIGEGGMGVVYKARQIRLDRTVAIKLLSAERDQHGLRERFEREAIVLGKLNHSNIVTVHDWGESEGRYFLIMEHVDGCSLAKLLPITSEQALKVGLAICEALEYAHACGIIHRDIKPANVLIGSDGSIRVADFGIAKLAEKPGANEPLTRTGVIIGTPGFCAPETMAGAPSDARSDIFSIGVLLYQSITGSLPDGESSVVPEPLASVIQKTLHVDPDQRFQNTAALKAALTAAGAGQPANSSTSREAPRARKTRIWLWAGALLAFGMLGALAFAMTRSSQSVRATIPSEGGDASLLVHQEADVADASAGSRQVTTDASIEAQTSRDAAPVAVEPKRRGTLVIRANPWADVRIDGKPMGRVEPPSRSFRVLEGRHRLVLNNPATGITKRRRVRIRPAKTTQIEVDLRKAAP